MLISVQQIIIYMYRTLKMLTLFKEGYVLCLTSLRTLEQVRILYTYGGSKTE